MDVTTNRFATFCLIAMASLFFTACGTEPRIECEVADDCEDTEMCRDSKCVPAECEIDEDCAPEERCLTRACFPVACNPECAEHEACVHGYCECASDEACEAWELCEEGACVADPEAECTPDRGCREGHTCRDARCVCERDRVCGPGNMCDDGVCVDAVACDSDAECDGDRLCDFGYCLEGCLSAAECGDPSFRFACLQDRCWHRCPAGDLECDEGFVCEGEADPVCVPAECATLADCGDPNQICTSAEHGRCVQVQYCESDSGCDLAETCRAPDPCPPGFDCATDMICVPRERCVSDQDCLALGWDGYCESGFCFRVEPCENRDDCDEGFDCVGGGCVPFVCRGPLDCEDGKICSGGQCVNPSTTASVKEVVILTPGGQLLAEETRQLTAVVYNNAGRIVIGAAIEWESDNPDSVAVDPETGEIQAGELPGLATITATYDGDHTASVNWLLLDDVVLDELRIVVVSAEDGRPVAGARVAVGSFEEETDEDGKAVFLVDGEGVVDVHVFASGRDYVSVFETIGRDLLVPLPKNSDPNLATGATGKVRHDGVSTTGDLAIGMAGTSLGGALPDLDFARLMGDMFVVDVMGYMDIPLPGSMTAMGSYQGFPITLKDTYYAPGEEGLRMGWAFAGRLPLDDMMSGGGGDMSLVGMLPMFSMFEHGLIGQMNLLAMDKIQNTADIYRDGDTSKMVPDWRSFPIVDQTPSQPQTMRLAVESGRLPSLDGTELGTVVLLAGGRMPGIGLVPLGLSASEGETVRMRMAPVYGGLDVGDYQIIAMAGPEQGELEMAPEVSARVHTSRALPTTVELGDFLGFPESATWDATTASISYEPVDGAHLLRVVVGGADRNWHVYAPGDVAGALQLPTVAEGADPFDAVGPAGISPIQLVSPLTFEDILHLGGASLLDLDRVTAGYSRVLR